MVLTYQITKLPEKIRWIPLFLCDLDGHIEDPKVQNLWRNGIALSRFSRPRCF